MFVPGLQKIYHRNGEKLGEQRPMFDDRCELCVVVPAGASSWNLPMYLANDLLTHMGLSTVV